ncbi:MAG: late competence development ComFB family protein [Treponema sp.]|jgi:competence protein ComFB|nr:late competence development ComFB family protein [Treponema sp.]
MEIHNISEDIVFNSIETIFASIKKEGNPEGLCLCEQCKLDTICYSLNRIEPRYIVSNRGMSRIEQDWAGRQQSEADIAALMYKGIRLVNHNQRPTSDHHDTPSASKVLSDPTYFIPSIIGRLFDGDTFAPLSGVTVELCCNGEVVPMRNSNWQNPFTLIANTPGTFTFWPAPVPADAPDLHLSFEYSLKVESPQYEPLTHFFKIPVVSSLPAFQSSYTLDRTFKLPDLYLFPPGEAEQNG